MSETVPTMSDQDRVTYWWSRAIAAEAKLKPRKLTDVEGLNALPEWSAIRVVKRKGHDFATYYEKVGRHRWLALDPGDKADGEDTWHAEEILRFNEEITVLYVPEDGGR
ncbi:hypothetical protein P3H15_27365 [Rhodococcus sp. T2V]|uniref:hypothetical protein n=1 Tax=Rhodococcus sp. T2V TaxID=3034164 RepID=UPI0023E1173F|nr:hypothetical protein [Rhodococcus sp. T2V]MDF3308742.1 hypothetical protein [Rhodococcus sp. T2V]